jgi:putative Mg2+ transporter-C (MgtC) family protein
MTLEDVIGTFNWQLLLHVLVRVGFAVLLGGFIGYEREVVGKPAGMRTHILVALGTALFVFPLDLLMVSDESLSRVIQGIGAGIGFIGAGTIIKDAQGEIITGLTSAAAFWATAAIGITVGLGQIWIATLCVVVVWLVLRVLGSIERRGGSGGGGMTQS